MGRPISSSTCWSQVLCGRPSRRFQSVVGGVPVKASMDRCNAGLWADMAKSEWHRSAMREGRCYITSEKFSNKNSASCRVLPRDRVPKLIYNMDWSSQFHFSFWVNLCTINIYKTNKQDWIWRMLTRIMNTPSVARHSFQPALKPNPTFSHKNQFEGRLSPLNGYESLLFAAWVYW